jgi:hypothetical protein
MKPVTARQTRLYIYLKDSEVAACFGLELSHQAEYINYTKTVNI